MPHPFWTIFTRFLLRCLRLGNMIFSPLRILHTPVTPSRPVSPSRTIVYRGLGHGFADQIGVMPQAEDLMAEIAAMMKEVL